MVRSIALGLTALTGFSGLVYEVAWQKFVAMLLGSHSEATAAVLGLFLGGLAIGYSLFGSVTRRVVARAAARGRAPHLLGLYGLVEASVGLHALLFPWLFGAVTTLSLAIPHQVSGTGFALDVVLVGILILPPTILMGATIPILTQALSSSLADSTRLHALVYACNTAGAFIGALAAAFVLIPWLGLESVVRVMGLINLAAGVSFGLLAVVRRPALADSDPSSSVPVRLGLFAPIALLSGFAAMALQTVLIRVGGLAIGSSQFTFSMIVAVFVLCIAIGSFTVSALPRIPRSLLVVVQASLALLLFALYPVIGDSPYWMHVIRTAFRDELVSFYFFYASVFIAVLGVLAVPIGLSGATLPLIFHQLRQELRGLGDAAGRLYAWNTVGSLIGALVGGYVLLFWLDLDQVYAVALGAVLVTVVLLAVRLFALPGATTVVLIPLLALLWLLPRWDPQMLSSGLFRTRTANRATLQGPVAALELVSQRRSIEFYTDDPAGSVAVLGIGESEGVLDLALLTNGKPDGSISGDYPTMALLALLPSLFADRVERAFVIGFGTGVTAGELAALDSVDEILITEISPGVIEAAPLFESSNLGALSDPKTTVIVSDAFRTLRSSQQRYDVIISEPSNPWVAGIEMLYSREFLEAARDRLTPDGVFAQWFHLYETDDEIVSLVLRTYASVFDRVSVWYTIGPDVILLGFNDEVPNVSLDALEQRVARPDFAAGLARAGIGGFTALLAHEILPEGVTRAAALEGEIHTLLHPLLSSRAARAFFIGRSGKLPPMPQPAAVEVAEQNSLLARLRARQGGILSETDYETWVGQVCGARAHTCASAFAKWQVDHPGSKRLASAIEQQRTQRPDASELDPKLLADLAILFGAPGLPEGRISDEAARRYTSLFIDFQIPGTPFDRSVLEEIWRRCKDANQGIGCAEARRETEKRLGPLRKHAAAPPNGAIVR